MLSFLKKCNIKPERIYFYLKYNLELPTKNNFFIPIETTNYILKEHKNRLVEILEKSLGITILGNDLKYLPDNIKNKKLTLLIHEYDKDYDLPNNWEIYILDFCYSHFLMKPKDNFKFVRLSLSYHQNLIQNGKL